MGDSEDLRDLRHDRVDHRERKPAKYKMAQSVVKPRTRIRVLEQQMDYAFDFIDEAEARLRYCRFVPRSGLLPFLLCFGMKFTVPSPRRLRSRSKTKGPGTPLTADRMQAAPNGGPGMRGADPKRPSGRSR